jgi:chromosome partitioning protein
VELEIKWIVPTFYDRRVSKSAEILEHLRQHFPDKLTAPIPYSVKLSEAPAWGQTVYGYAPRDRGAAAYAKLAEALL